MTTSTSTPGSKVGRARRRLSQLWQVPTFLVGLLAFIGVAGSAPWRQTPQEREFDKLVAGLRQALEHNESGDDVVGHAESVRLRMHLFRSRAAEAHFLVGSAYYRQAQQKPAILAKEIWPRAVEHLEEALASGVADADRAALQYRLGFSLYQQNPNHPRAIELMMLGVEKGAEHPLQGYQLLVKANLHKKPPNLDAALSASARILDLTSERDVEPAALARLQHGEILLDKQMRAEALKELERIGPKASRAVRVKARLLQARCCEEEGLWAKAIPIWQELLAEPALVEGGRARILYALGWCHHNQMPANDAETMRVWSEALKCGGLEGQAAGLQLGKLRLPLGGQQTVLALANWKDALDKVNSPQDYRNPYVTKEQVIEWLDKAKARFDEARDPQKSNAVAELYRKLAPGGGADYRRGQAAEALAQLLAAKLDKNFDSVTPADVQAQYRRAAEAYEQAAKTRPEAERPEALWRSIQCYLSAQDNPQAQQLLLQYVKVEIREPRLAKAWHALGDLFRTEGKQDNAQQAYHKCLEYPNTPFAYRSRYYLAIEEIDKKNYAQAHDILKQNLTSGSIDIERAWQEKSLFKMAMLLMEMKNYAEAHVHLKDFRRLFPENQYALVAREQLGECYRRLAEAERLKEDDLRRMIRGDTPFDRREALSTELLRVREARLKLVKQAIEVHEELADELKNTLFRTKHLSSHEQTLLRRAWLGIGGCQLDYEEFDAALDTFWKLQDKNRCTLEGLIASRFICYAVYKMPLQQMPKRQADDFREKAKASVRMVLEDVKSLPADHEIFRGPGVWQRDAWVRWTEETQRQLAAPPRSEGGAPFP